MDWRAWRAVRNMNARCVPLQVLWANEIYCSAVRLHAVHLSVFIQSIEKTQLISLTVTLPSLTRRRHGRAIVELRRCLRRIRETFGKPVWKRWCRIVDKDVRYVREEWICSGRVGSKEPTTHGPSFITHMSTEASLSSLIYMP